MKSLLLSTCNTRDLGGYSCPGGVTRAKVFLRSDAPKDLLDTDLQLLQSFGIRTVIDLRTTQAEEDIIRDYALTREYGKQILENVFRMFPDADRRIVTPLPEHMAKFLELFRQKYGTADGYMRAIGLTRTQIRAIRIGLQEN